LHQPTHYSVSASKRRNATRDRRHPPHKNQKRQAKEYIGIFWCRYRSVKTNQINSEATTSELSLAARVRSEQKKEGKEK
jgi:hypothetical protein